MTAFQQFAKMFPGKQRDLAEALRISRPHLSLLLAGKKRPSLRLAVCIERMTDGAVPVTSWVDDAVDERCAP
jgi:plasmid maintenance system antidote protein VapI